MKPRLAFFDAKRKAELRYRFRAPQPIDVEIRVARSGSGKVVRRWTERGLRPGLAHERRWNGRRKNGRVAPNGRYRFELQPQGGRVVRADSFRLRDHRFPVRGTHHYGDPFGVPRSGGRVHEGQDIVAGCGTRLVAARGGRVQARGYSDALYGYWVLIDGRATRHDHFYSHLEAPTPLGDGERVRTGERIGAVGKTGNARSEFCQLHFELWPHGYRRGGAADPLAKLRRWDGWS